MGGWGMQGGSRQALCSLADARLIRGRSQPRTRAGAVGQSNWSSICRQSLELTSSSRHQRGRSPRQKGTQLSDHALQHRLELLTLVWAANLRPHLAPHRLLGHRLSTLPFLAITQDGGAPYLPSTISSWAHCCGRRLVV